MFVTMCLGKVKLLHTIINDTHIHTHMVLYLYSLGTSCYVSVKGK